MDEIDQLTTNEVGRADLAEIGNVGQSELLSTCELLGGRTLRISRAPGCDLLTREREFLGSWSAQRQLAGPWRCRDSDVGDKTHQKLYQGRRLFRAALKPATHLLDTGRSLRVGVASRLSGAV